MRQAGQTKGHDEQYTIPRIIILNTANMQHAQHQTTTRGDDGAILYNTDCMH